MTRPRAPAWSLLVSEPGRALVDYLSSHLPAAPLPRGDGHPVIVYPGLGTGAWSTRRLRDGLSGADFTALDWGFGENHGPRGTLADWLAQLRRSVEAVATAHGRTVSLVGWSLGGIYAREIARVAPDLVRQVVSLGSPFAAGPEATHAAWLYRLLNGAGAPRAQDMARLRRPLPVPSTSVYSKSDGVVSWRACLQTSGPRSQNIEVRNVSHLGMGTNRKVLEIVADRLAQPEGRWRRYDGPA